jgi:hypothetical protein
MITHTDPRRVCARAAAFCLIALSALLLPGRAPAQWATSGNNINNTNTGNVGVGTGASAPAGKLDVKGDTADTTAAALNVRNSTDANLLFVRNDGRIGISTTTPLAVFHVAKGDPSTGGAAFFQKDSSSGGVALGTTNNLGFLSGANYNYTASTDLLINPFGGNVGIGTNAPAFKLDVVGFGRFSGAGAGVSLNNSNGWTQFVASRTGAMQAAFIAVPSVAYSVNSPYWAMGLSADGSAGWSLDTWDGANLITRMRMLPGGDLGIGTTAPSSARLHLYSPAHTYLRIGAPLAYQSSIAFNDDTNGQDIVLYRPEGTRNFSLWTATAGQVLNVTQAGGVGVGTNAPGYKFDVQGGQVNASGGLCIAGDCKTAWSQVGGGSSSQWTTNGTNIYFNTGNVGVGVTNPASNLQVGTQTPGPTAAPSSLSLGGSYSNSAGANLKLKLYDDGVVANTYGIGVSSASMDFGVSPTAGYNWYSGGTHVMALTTGGYVGVGTMSPSLQTGATNKMVEIKGSVNPGLGLTATSAGGRQFFLYSSQTNPGYFSVFDATATADRFVIDSRGNVGVGTAGPVFDANAARYFTLDGGSGVIGSVGAGGGTGNAGTAISQFAALNTALGTTDKRIATVVGSTDTASNNGRLDFYTWSGPSSPVDRVAILSNGNVGVGTTSPAAKLDVNGNVSVTGDITATGNIAAKYQDMAEWVASSQKLSAGTVVILDPSATNRVQASVKSYDTGVAGVVSERPGIALGECGEGKLLVATTGRVRVKVDATRAPIKVGDLLVTSDLPGAAMKSQPVEVGGVQIHRPGTLIGKALEPLDKGVGEILVLLSLQ